MTFEQFNLLQILRFLVIEIPDGACPHDRAVQGAGQVHCSTVKLLVRSSPLERPEEFWTCQRLWYPGVNVDIDVVKTHGSENKLQRTHFPRRTVRLP